MPLPSKYKSEKEKPILSLTKGTIYSIVQFKKDTYVVFEFKGGMASGF